MREPMFDQSPLKEECVARALFPNTAEYPDELPFEKGDILRVLAQKPVLPGVSDGWWLCVDREGRKGIVPANRIQIMHRFDQGFFQVASPLMDDFFQLNHSSPFDEPFFRGRPAFSSSLRDRLEPAPLRRLNSCDDAMKGAVVRNIPIRVENTDRPFQSNLNISERLPERRFSDFPREVRRTVSTGRVSPPLPPVRRSYLAASQDQPYLAAGQEVPPRPRSTVSSDEEERRSLRSERSPQRTLVIPSSIPGRSIEILLDDRQNEGRALSVPVQRERSRSPKPESQIEKLTQRLKNLAHPFRSESSLVVSPPEVTLSTRDDRSPSPSSSGICADINDNSGEENKRSSDLSSLSSSDHNSSLSDHGDEARLLPPIISRPSVQPYLSRLTREKSPSTSVLQAVFENIDRPPLSKYASQNTLLPSNNREWVIPSTVGDDMRRNDTAAWNHVPTKITPVPINRAVGDVLEEEVHARKRVVCNKMSDCLRMIEVAVATIQKCSAAQHWRAPHLLQPNLNSLRDAVSSLNQALDLFVDGTGRISIDRSNPKAHELSRLLAPLTESRSLIGCLRRVLDQAGWTVAVLSRDRQQRTMDSLEQFVAVAPQVSVDCSRLLQWVLLLVPSSSVLFLSPSSFGSNPSPFPHPTSQAVERPQLLPSLPDSEKRLSSSSTSTVTSSDTPSSILVTRKDNERPRGRVTFADQTSSDRTSNGSIDSTPEYSTIQKPNGIHKPVVPPTGPAPSDSRIMEEDDLESVISDRDSLYQDYAYLDDVVPGRSNGNGIANNEGKRRIDDEDRQLVRFYAPQLETHTGALSVAIEEFLGAVELNLPPREFVQKGKLIILAAHKLIYIGDKVSQCVRDREASHSMRQAADDLCELLKDCVRATKQAADEYPEIRSMQSMVDSIIAVSKSAHQLKMMIKECC